MASRIRKIIPILEDSLKAKNPSVSALAEHPLMLDTESEVKNNG